MAIPDFQSIMRPLLVLLADGREWSVKSIRDTLAGQFALTDDELEERLPSGRDRTYRNRVGWALTHLKGATVIESPRRGVYRITECGRRVLADTPETERVDRRTLSTLEEYRESAVSRYRSPNDADDSGATTATTAPVEPTAGTPTEQSKARIRSFAGCSQPMFSTGCWSSLLRSSNRWSSTCSRRLATEARGVTPPTD